MCLAIPGKVLSLAGNDPLLRTGNVSFGGVIKQVNLAYVPDVQVGDYVIVHVGFAISRLETREAERVFSYLQELEDLEGDERA